MHRETPIKVGKRAIAQLLTWITSVEVTFFVGEALFCILGLRRARRSALAEPRRILVARLDNIGDVVMSSAFLRELRRNFPSAHISLLVRPSTRNLVETCPHVDEVLSFDCTKRGRLAVIRLHLRALRLALMHCWFRRYDLAISPRRGLDTHYCTLLMYMSGSPKRVGCTANHLASRTTKESPLEKLLTDEIPSGMTGHEVAHNLKVIKFIGGEVLETHLEMWLTREDQEIAERLIFEGESKTSGILIGLAPGASSPKKAWPIQRFTELGEALRQRYSCRLLVIGGRGEEEYGRTLRAALGGTVIDVVGRTTLRQTAALLRHCQILIGNDSGPMHMAAAVGVPVVELYHSAAPSTFGLDAASAFHPWEVPYTLVRPQSALPPCRGRCGGTGAHCILAIETAEVFRIVQNRLDDILKGKKVRAMNSWDDAKD